MFRAGCDLSEIINFLVEKLKTVESLEKLTIIDPYFFKYSHSKFAIPKNVMVDTLSNFTELQILEIVTPSDYTVAKKEKLELEIKKIIPNLELNIVHTQGFHDRFWIMNERKGFIVGTSLNGMTNKHFFIQDEFLSDKDIRELLEIYRET